METQYAERHALEQLAKPYRWKTGWSADGEAIIQGKRGVIEWHSAEMQTLAAYTTNRGVMKLWLPLPWVHRHQWADKEWRVTFPVSHLKTMADFIKVKTKRQPGAHLKQFHFQSRLQGQKTAQESTIGPEVGHWAG